MMSAGQWVQQVTLGWLLYDLTGNSMLLGALNGLRALPFLVTGPMAGVAADRMDRRKLLLRTQWVLIVTAILFGALVASPFLHVWHIFLFTLITGVAWTVTEPVRMSMIPSVVPKTELANAVALNSGGFNLMKVIGPALGGMLIAWFGAAENFFLQGTAYIGVLCMIYWMNIPPQHAETRRATAYANLKEGFAYCLAYAGGAGANDAGLRAASVRRAVPDAHAGISKRRAQNRSGWIGLTDGRTRR